MTFVGCLQIALVLALVLVAAWPLGLYMARVFQGERTALSAVFRPVETFFYQAAGIKREAEQSWLTYALSMLALNGAGFILLYALMRLQFYLPINPQGFAGVPPDLAFNTAVSFVTNTNWQSYAGETTMSHFVQMAGFTVQNFISAATGIALALAVTRGVRTQQCSDSRKFLGRSYAVDAVRAAAIVNYCCPCVRIARRSADTVRQRRCDHTRRRQTVDRPRPCRQPRSDQTTWHQRRRVLQCQRCASVRKPQRLV